MKKTIFVFMGLIGFLTLASINVNAASCQKCHGTCCLQDKQSNDFEKQSSSDDVMQSERFATPNRLHINMNAIPENLRIDLLEGVSAMIGDQNRCCTHHDGRHCPCDD